MNKLAKFVGLACGGVVALSSPVYAAEPTEEKEVERIAVTGSRLKRVDMEGATPVTTITADQMLAAGYTNAGDALRASNLNSFGSYGGTSNNTWSSQATIQLKGAGAGATLVLLDGKRMAKSPVLGGNAANINTIPTAAIERIEILSDGASAIYGTDAVAGVVNVILKKDFEGVEFTARAERPENDGGNAKNFSFSGGLSSEYGNIVFVMEHQQKSKVLYADRDYTSAGPRAGGDQTDWQNWNGVSQTGRTIEMNGGNGDWRWLHPFTNEDVSCDVYGDRFVGPLSDSQYPGDYSCAYDYTHSAASDVDRERTNTLINYSYNITDDIELIARAYWASNETIDQSAPTPQTFYFGKAMPAYTTDAGLHLRETTDVARMKMRFDTVGNRVRENHDNMYDVLFGLNGSTDDIDWDFSASFNRYDNFIWGTGYIVNSAATDAVGSWNNDTQKFEGWDPRDPASATPDGIAANQDWRQTGQFMEFTAGAGFTLFELPAGEVGMYLGASYRDESLKSEIDALSAAGLIGGGSGSSGGIGDRDVTAVYTELAVPVLDNMELSIAARYDDYSDFGGTFNPQVSLRYNVIEPLVLRASWGTGFKAPSLANVNMSPSLGYGNVTNYLSCYENGNLDDCTSTNNIGTYMTKNGDLEPEESESYNIGASWDIIDNINMTVDYWVLETDNLISALGESGMLWTLAKTWEAADAQGVARPQLDDIFPNTSVSRAANGRLTGMTNQLVNLSSSEREGLDAKIAANFETDIGDFKLGLAWSHYFNYTLSTPNKGVIEVSENKAGRINNPDDRISFTAQYSFAEDHSFFYEANYIDDQRSYTKNEDDSWYMIDDIVYHTLSYTYQMPWNNSLSLGVNNLTDEDPSLEKNKNYSSNLYDINGRRFWASFTQRF